MKRLFWVIFMAAVPGVATALECKSDKDCPEGYVCAGVTCPACAPGQECPPCDAKSECVKGQGPQECKSDSDCPTGFACKESAEPCPSETCTCACPACDPDKGAECPPCECPPCKEPEPCEPVIHHYCDYQPKECKSDADCDQGFECVALEECSGGGCACAGCVCPPCDPSEGKECAPCDCPKDPPPCDCEASEPTCSVVSHVCTPKVIECKADSDCPNEWQCVFVDMGCACPACACKEGAPDCQCEPCACDNASQNGYCMPKGFADGGLGTPQAAYDAAATKAGADKSSELPEGAEGRQYAAPTNAAQSSGSSASKGGCGAGVLSFDLMGLSGLAALFARLWRRRR